MQLEKTSIPAEQVLCISIFCNASGNREYQFVSKEIHDSLPESYSGRVPVAILAQAPANGSGIAAEIYALENAKDWSVVSVKDEDLLWMRATSPEGMKLVVANGIGNSGESLHVPAQAREAFEKVLKILRSEGMNFRNIFRQWNYIENITKIRHEAPAGQHYQQFNEVRAGYYARDEFPSGYPAATGIGVCTGGVQLGFFAATGGELYGVSIENPLQTKAFEYSEKVLPGGTTLCSPKFSRARLLASSGSQMVFISGTASIRDEQTIGEDDAGMQTLVTIENMKKLISGEVLAQAGYQGNKLPVIRYFRAYIKDRNFYREVRGLCEQHMPGASGIYVISDMCRPNLLVEIEALAVP